MASSQHLEFLESKILTASSHQLHLMLIEGALRFGRQARQALERGDRAAAEQPLARAIDVVSEMLVGVRSVKSDLNTKLVALYAFVLQCLADAKFEKETGKLDEALGILEYERQTWQMLCTAQTECEPATDEGPVHSTAEPSANRPPLRLHVPSDAYPAGFSLEA